LFSIKIIVYGQSPWKPNVCVFVHSGAVGDFAVDLGDLVVSCIFDNFSLRACFVGLKCA